MKFRQYLKSFLNLIFPNICVSCNTVLAGNELYVCTHCISQLPTTGFWLHKDNPIEELFWGRLEVDSAASFVFYEKGSHIQKILHHIKYKQKPDLGIVMGKLFGIKLIDSRFSDIDIIVPIPLHKARLSKRGFNQSEKIALGIGLAMNKPVEVHTIKRARATNTQTSKSRFERWLNVEGVFEIIKPKYLIGKHILVVDDIVTTGATSESFMHELLKVPGVKVSFAAIGSA